MKIWRSKHFVVCHPAGLRTAWFWLHTVPDVHGGNGAGWEFPSNVRANWMFTDLISAYCFNYSFFFILIFITIIYFSIICFKFFCSLGILAFLYLRKKYRKSGVSLLIQMLPKMQRDFLDNAIGFNIPKVQKVHYSAWQSKHWFHSTSLAKTSLSWISPNTFLMDFGSPPIGNSKPRHAHFWFPKSHRLPQILRFYYPPIFILFLTRRSAFLETSRIRVRPFRPRPFSGPDFFRRHLGAIGVTSTLLIIIICAVPWFALPK